MYEQIIKLFELKRETALHLKAMGRKDLASIETLLVLGFTKNAYEGKYITRSQKMEIDRMVNDFCDSIE